MWGDFLANMGVDGDAAGLCRTSLKNPGRGLTYTQDCIGGQWWLFFYFRTVYFNVRQNQTSLSLTGVTVYIVKVCRLSLLHPLVVGCEGFL